MCVGKIIIDIVRPRPKDSCYGVIYGVILATLDKHAPQKTKLVKVSHKQP